jgi:hypothetical protein
MEENQHFKGLSSYNNSSLKLKKKKHRSYRSLSVDLTAGSLLIRQLQGG